MPFTSFKPRRTAQAPVTESGRPCLWALVDCQTFYCSCERLFRPDLKDKPVVVLSNNDGCLISLSQEARALGFKMGDVYYQAEKRLRAAGVAVFSSNYALYGDLSRRVIETMESVAPEVDQYSIDEAFVPFNAVMAAQADEVGRELHDRVRQWVGIPVRVGIGPTRTLSKLANHWAKRKSRVYRLEAGSAELERLLEATAVDEVWGVGRRMAKKLASFGIATARQLRDMDADLARKHLSVVGFRTVMELRGVQCIMEDKPSPRQTLVSSRSFGRQVTKKEDLAEALAMHCAIAGERLRRENMEASAIQIWVSTARYVNKPYTSLGTQVHLACPTNITRELTAAAHEALDHCYKPGLKFMKGGIMLYNLTEVNRGQITLLESAARPERQKNQDLMGALDKINGLYGEDTLRYGAQGQADAFWHMRREKMSGCFTTNWNELARAKA